MRVYTENADTLFLQHLEMQRDKGVIHAGLRCAVLELSESQLRLLVETPQFFPTLSEIVSDPHSSCYVCENGQMILLFNGVNYKEFEVLEGYIVSLLGLISLERLVNIYDVGKDINTLLVFADRAVTTLQPKTAAKEIKVVDSQDQKEALQVLLQGAIHENLLTTLQERRQDRREISLLIIEDDPFSCQLAKKAMTKDFEVHTAVDGKAGIEAYFYSAPDVVFLDIDLPDISGHELLETILRHDEDAFVVMLSGNSDKTNVLKAVQDGAKGFVGKPFARQKLLDYIKQCPKAQSGHTVLA